MEVTPPPARNFIAPADPEKSVRPAVALPDYKPLFDYEKPEPVEEPLEEQSGNDEPRVSAEKMPAWIDKDDQAPFGDEAPLFDPANQPVESVDLLEEEEEEREDDELTQTGLGPMDQRLTELEEKLSLVTEERDQVRSELEVARGRSSGAPAAPSGTDEDLSTASRERDEARMEVIVLRHQLESAEQARRDTDAMASQLEELSHVIDERDSVRRDYAALREQFETLKLDRTRMDSSEAQAELEEEINRLREELAHRPEPGEATGTAAEESTDVSALREELQKAKNEASVSQRGLNLSQKALQETREALREASEGTSMSKGTLEDLKKERATLIRQNMLIQGQNDQLTRDLSAAKAKLAAKSA